MRGGPCCRVSSTNIRFLCTVYSGRSGSCGGGGGGGGGEEETEFSTGVQVACILGLLSRCWPPHSHLILTRPSLHDEDDVFTRLQYPHVNCCSTPRPLCALARWYSCEKVISERGRLLLRALVISVCAGTLESSCMTLTNLTVGRQAELAGISASS